MVRGDVSSVRAAVEAGAEAAGRVGELKAAHVIPAAGPRRSSGAFGGGSARVKILVANLGSTSFKYRLFDMGDPAEPVLARGAIERIGSPNAKVVIKSARGERELVGPIADHGEAVQLCLDQLTDPEIGVLADAAEVSAIGFKAVHARNLTGVHLVDESVLAAMEAFADVAPAHNPPYTKAMRMLRDRFPQLPLVAAFETGFHRTIPEANQRYAIPDALGDRAGHPPLGVPRRQPPLHRRPDGRAAGPLRHQGHLLPPRRQLVALRDPQRQVGRVQPGHEPAVGPAAQQPRGRLRRLRPAGHPPRDRQDRSTRCSTILANQSGLEGLSGAGATSATSRPPRRRATPRPSWPSTSSSPRSATTSAPISSSSTGPTRSSSPAGSARTRSRIRSGVCRDLDWFGIELDPRSNAAGPAERVVSTAGSRVQVWTVPTNEEIVVARQSQADLLGQTRQPTRVTARCSWPG